MSSIGRDKPLGVTLATGALKELFGSDTPEAIEKRLTDGTGVSGLARLRAVLTQLDVIDEPGRANPAALEVARAVFGSISKPKEFVDLLSRILGTDPKTLTNFVGERLTNGVYVAKEQFAARSANLAVERKVLSPIQREALLSIGKELDALGLGNAADVARAFIDHYQAITGGDVVFEPRSIAALYRDHGSHILAHLKRPVRLALISTTSANASSDQTPLNEGASLVMSGLHREHFSEAIASFMSGLFSEIDRHGLAATTSVLAGFEANGTTGAFYAAATKFDAIERGAVTDATIAKRPVAFVDRATLLGTAAGDAQALFDDLAAGAMLVAVTPRGDDVERLKAHCKRGGVAIVVQETALDPALDIQGVLQLSLASDPAVEAAAAAQYVRAKIADRGQQSFVSAAEHMAISKAPSEINEIRQWAREESSRYRLVRLQNATLEKLSGAHPDASVAKISGWTLEVARNIARYTHGIDNFKQNSAWQAQAKLALKESGPEVAAIADELAMDVMFASWFGIREFNEAPSYFDEHTTQLEFPKELDRLSEQAEHTFDKDAYAEVRLDHITSKFLGAADSRPEVFLGSREEMQLYYRSRGFELDCTTHDSNGTEFHYFRSDDASKPSIMVMHGIDSEARLLQVAALMRVNGVDPRRCLVRGELARVRDVNRSLLEHRLMEVVASGVEQKAIAGVVIGNKNEAIDAIAKAVGVAASKLNITEHRAGPFRFRSVEVRTTPDGPPQLFLAFAPAYGQLSEDVVTTVAKVGARNFMIGGAGGSLNADDEINSVHRITRCVYGDQVIAFDDGSDAGVVRPPNVKLIAVDGLDAHDAVNVFSPTPLEQDKVYLARARDVAQKVARGASARADVDQETGAIFAGIARAAEAARAAGRDNIFYIQSTLVQSDVVGKGALARGTVDNGYAERILASAQNFIKAIGVLEVAIGDTWTVVPNAVAPVVAVTAAAPTLGAESVNGVLPKMGTMIASWKSSAEQFKGQKVPYRIVAERFGPDEEAFLEKLLMTLNPGDIWVVVDAADVNHHKITDSAKRYDGALAPNSARIRDVAEKYGFETIVMALESEKPAIRGYADYLLSYGSERSTDEQRPGKLDVIERFQAPGNADEDPSYAIPRDIVLGAKMPAVYGDVSVPNSMSEAELTRFLEIVDVVQESIAGIERDPKKKAERLIAERETVIAKVEALAAAALPCIGTASDPLQATRDAFAYLRDKANKRAFVFTGALSGPEQDRVIAAMQADINVAFEGGVRMYSDGLTHRFPGLKRAITDHAHELVAAGKLAPPPARTGEGPLLAPKFYPLDGLDSFFQVAGTGTMRKPLLWCGASRSSWPNIAAKSQYSLHLFVEVMAKLLAGDKDKYAMVTGGTKYGLEEIVHEVFAREGWHILATLSQNTSVTADNWEPDERIWHYTFPGINWFGVARPVAEDIVARYGGSVVNIAGGGIALDQIGLHLALNLDAWQMTGLAPSDSAIAALQKKLDDKAQKAGKPTPVVLSDEQKRWAAGASVEMGEKFPARAFDTLDGLCEHFGLTEQLAAVKAKLKITGPAGINDLAPLAQKLGIDTAAIAARYDQATNASP